MENLQKREKHICMISDDNYVIPTCVTIKSVIDSQSMGDDYRIHIIASALTEKSEQLFKNLETENVNIDIVRQNAEEQFSGFHTFDSDSICSASISALLKFILADLFPDLDEILYLDGDLIVKESLDYLFDIRFEDEYVAAIVDSGSIYYKHEYVLKVQDYFNSGVMLLNLAKMRHDKIGEKLCQTKKELSDASLMDQNVFNLVLDKRVKLLPIKYNFMPVSLDRSNSKWTIEQINETYSTSYKNKKELYSDAVIIHYSSKDKPWKNLDGACASEWISYYLKTPIDHEITSLKKKEEDVGISVIMPCYNVENYIRETLDSVLKQTFYDYEIICLDDGSTDHTLDILHEYEEKYNNISVFSDTNHGQGYERNIGIRKARGKYIYYMDSDDLLSPNCFDIIYTCAEENNLDLLFFEGTSFYESEELELQFPQYKWVYNRKEAYPKVYEGETLYVELRKRGDWIVSPCLQLIKRSYLLEKKIQFPELPLMEDNLYVFHVLICAKRVKCLYDILFYRRVRDNSTMTVNRSQDRIKALTITIKETLKEFVKHEKGSPMYLAIASHIRGYLKNVYMAYEELPEEVKNNLDDLVDELQWIVAILALYFEVEEHRVHELNSRLQCAWKEKSEINRKLQITYGEKAERGKEIKRLKEAVEEKSVTINITFSFSCVRKIRKILSKFKSKFLGNNRKTV